MPDFGATSFENYIAEINTIMDNVMNNVMNINNTEDCCDYEYQILDKFCATRPAVSIACCINYSMV